MEARWFQNAPVSHLVYTCKSLAIRHVCFQNTIIHSDKCYGNHMEQNPSLPKPFQTFTIRTSLNRRLHTGSTQILKYRWTKKADKLV